MLRSAVPGQTLPVVGRQDPWNQDRRLPRLGFAMRLGSGDGAGRCRLTAV